jgi:hypothetical protein
MIDQPLTLSVLAGLDAEGTNPLGAAERERLAKELSARAQTFAALKPFDLGDRLLGFITDALRKPVASVLGEMWKQRREMREAAARGVGDRAVEGEVKLFDHEMRLTVHPTVKLQLNGQDVGPLAFDVPVSFKLHAMRLVMRNASITAIRTGTLKSTIGLQYKTLPLMAPRECTIDLSREFRLPGEGIRLH